MKEYKLRAWELAALCALCVSLCVGTWAQGRQQDISSSLVRLHVIAASDESGEQELKLRVRDNVLEYLTPVLDKAGSPEEVYKSISDKMAKNGFFARLLVIDGGMRGCGKTPLYRELPTEIVERCKTLSRYQSDFTAWGQMRGDWDGTGEVIHMTMDAEDFRAAFVRDAEAHYNTEEDGVENAVWNRTVEKAEKLAMIFAASDNQDEPKMDLRHWQLARQLVEYSNAHQIEMLAKYSSETDYEDLQKRILRKLEKGITCNRALLSFLKIRNEDLREAMETLQAAGKVIFCNENGEEMPEWKRGISYALA